VTSTTLLAQRCSQRFVALAEEFPLAAGQDSVDRMTTERQSDGYKTPPPDGARGLEVALCVLEGPTARRN
jgi:hypothetical protein